MLIYKNYQHKVLLAVDNYLKKLHQHKKPTLAFADYFDTYDEEITGVEHSHQFKPYPKSPKVSFACVLYLQEEVKPY
jgi:hypothetical protein